MKNRTNSELFELVLKKTLSSQKVGQIDQINWEILAKKTNLPANSLLRFFTSYRGYRKSKLLKELCGYFDIDMNSHSKKANKIPHEIINAVTKHWDGSAQHTQLICSLIRVSNEVATNTQRAKV